MIKKLIINNLKAIEQLTVEFSNHTIISGRNGVGKSTIKEAITFVLYGKINNTDRIDDAIKDNAPQAKVTAVINVGGGDIIISRTRTTKGSSLEINGRPADQSDIYALFGTYDNFVSANFVGEFMKYSEAEKREILMGLYPAPGREELFEKLTGEKASAVDLSDLEATEKKLKAIVKGNTMERNLLSSQKETLNAELFRLKDEFSKANEIGQDHSAEIVKIKSKLNQARDSKPDKSSFMPPVANTEDIDKKISDITLELMNISTPDKSSITALEMMLSEKKREYERVKASTVCPTCKRPYEDVSHVNIKTTELTEEIKKYYTEYLEKKKLYDLEVEATLKKKNTLVGDRASLEAKRKEIFMQTEMLISEVNEKFESAMKRWNSDVLVLQEELDRLSLLQKDYEVSKGRADVIKESINNTSSRIDALMMKLKDLDTSYEEKLLKAFGPKGIAFQEILSQQTQVNELLPEHVKIEFMKENKTNDGFKPTFNVISNGISYPWLSTGMKLEVDMLLLSLFPASKLAVIDNFEAYTGEIPKALESKQIILLVAQKSELNISSETKEAPKPKAKAKPVAKKAVKKTKKS